MNNNYISLNNKIWFCQPEFIFFSTKFSPNFMNFYNLRCESFETWKLVRILHSAKIKIIVLSNMDWFSMFVKGRSLANLLGRLAWHGKIALLVHLSWSIFLPSKVDKSLGMKQNAFYRACTLMWLQVKEYALV